MCCLSDLLADAASHSAFTKELLSSHLSDCADAAVTLLGNAALARLPPRPPAIDGERPGRLLFREDHARSNGGRRRYSQPGLRQIDRWQMQGGGGTTRLPLPARLQHGDLPQVLVRRAGFVHRHQRPRLRFRQFEIQSVAVGRSAKRGPVVYVLDDGALDPLVDVHDARPARTVAQQVAPAGEIAVYVGGKIESSNHSSDLFRATAKRQKLFACIFSTLAVLTLMGDSLPARRRLTSLPGDFAAQTEDLQILGLVRTRVRQTVPARKLTRSRRPGPHSPTRR